MKLIFSQTEIDRILALALDVGAMLLRAQATAKVQRTKENQTPESDADVAADQMIQRELRLAFPGTPVLSEETAVPDFAERKKWERFWLVDPLDGTKEFLQGRPDFTVNIALIEGNVPVFGVVFAPGSDELFWGATDEPAAYKKVGDQRTRIYSQPLIGPADEAVVMESRSHPSPELETYLRKFNIKQRIQLGSSLKICRLAEGVAHFYPRLGPTMEWDIAAADAVYRSAGRNGANPSPLVYNKESLLNPHFALGLKPEEPQPV